LALQELRRALAVQLHNADQLDDKLKGVLRSASLILSIVVSLQASIGAKQVGMAYFAGLIVALLAYAALVIVVIGALHPKTYHLPVPTQWEELAQRYFDEAQQAALHNVISTYLDALEKNQAPIVRKKTAVLCSSLLLVAIVLVLVFMTLTVLNWSTVGLWKSSPLPTALP
jgi:hypothetical protein